MGKECKYYFFRSSNGKCLQKELKVFKRVRVFYSWNKPLSIPFVRSSIGYQTKSYFCALCCYVFLDAFNYRARTIFLTNQHFNIVLNETFIPEKNWLEFFIQAIFSGKKQFKSII